MLIEVNYVFLSLILVVYSTWRYIKGRGKYRLYLTGSFVFLTLSTSFQILSSKMLVYGIQVNIMTLRLLEIAGIAFFTCFIIMAIIGLKEMSAKQIETAQ